MKTKYFIINIIKVVDKKIFLIVYKLNNTAITDFCT